MPVHQYDCKTAGLLPFPHINAGMMQCIWGGGRVLAGRRQGLLSEESLALFCRCTMGDGVLPRPRLGALVVDFACVARGERPADVLLAYAL